MRFTARARTHRSPAEVWALLSDARHWTALLRGPGGATPLSRVKLLDGVQEVTEGCLVQALGADRSWTTYRVNTWRPGKQLDLAATQSGHGEAEGSEVNPRRAERVIVIPQGGGAEIECTIVLDIGGLGRLLGPLVIDRSGWQAEAERRVAWLADAATSP